MSWLIERVVSRLAVPTTNWIQRDQFSAEKLTSFIEGTMDTTFIERIMA